MTSSDVTRLSRERVLADKPDLVKPRPSNLPATTPLPSGLSRSSHPPSLSLFRERVLIIRCAEPIQTTEELDEEAQLKELQAALAM